jgi:hypothetical protein
MFNAHSRAEHGMRSPYGQKVIGGKNEWQHLYLITVTNHFKRVLDLNRVAANDSFVSVRLTVQGLRIWYVFSPPF